MKVDVGRLSHRRIFEADVSSADTHDALAGDFFSILVCDQIHGIGMGNVRFGHVEDDIAGNWIQRQFDDAVSAVTFAGFGQ